MGNRIKNLRIEKGLSQDDLAKTLNVQRAVISKYENGKTVLTDQTIERLTEVFNVTADYLLGITDVREGKNTLKIPVVGLVKAGLPSEAIENIIDWEEIPRDWLRGGKEYFALEISGDSMLPRMEEGDVIIVQKQQWCDSGDIVVVRVNGEDATVKKVVKQDDGIMLVAFNPSYEPIFYSNKQMQDLPVEYLGKVVELRGKF